MSKGLSTWLHFILIQIIRYRYYYILYSLFFIYIYIVFKTNNYKFNLNNSYKLCLVVK